MYNSNMFSYKNKKLYCENVLIEKIVKETGTPVYIYSKNKIRENYSNYDSAFRPIPHLVCFAVKSNTNHSICKTIFSSGSGADVTSYGELYRALRAGASNKKIVFAGVGKNKQEIEYALRENIFMFNVESLAELELLDRISKKMNKRPFVALRINPNIDPHTHRHISTGKKETKFGIPVKDAVRTYLNSGKYKNIHLCGIHCHIGSQITSIKPFTTMARKLYEITRYLKIKGIYIKYINIGGGLGIRYHNEKPPAPKEMAKEILRILKNLKITLILEPGRYIVGNAGVLVTKIMYHKSGQNKKFLVVDAGMNDIIRPTLYNAYHELIPLTIPDKKKAKSQKIDVVGPICETGDFIAKDRLLPVLNTGECFTVRNAGAYCFTMSSQYNSRCRSPEVMVDGNRWYVIRRRETYKDLISTEISK